MNISRRLLTEYTYPVAFSGWDAEEYIAMQRVISSDHFTMGAEVEAFEAEFSAYHNMKHAIMVNSGSSANLISVAALQHGGPMIGKVVSVPALAWSTTYAPFAQHGYTMDVLDVDETWNVREAGSVVCSILGNACNARGLVLLEDCCESVGAKTVDGKLAGTRGLLNTFSFYFSHQLSAVEGGMILTNDDNLAWYCRLLRSHGWTRGLKEPSDLSGEYEFTAMGYNVRPIEMHAAIARVQLGKLEDRILARLVNFAYWRRWSEGLPLIHPEFNGRPSPFGIHFQVESREIRQKLANALRANGIDCRPPVAGSFRLQPYGKRWSDQQTPNADRIHETGLMIGNPPFDGSQLIDMAVKVMKETL